MKRTALELGVAVAACVVLGLAEPLAGDDPLRPVLVALPLLVAAARALERLGRRTGGRTLPPGLLAAEGFALVGLFLLALLGPGFGLDSSVPAAGLALVLLTHAGFQALAWRPLLRREAPGRVPPVFLLLVLLVDLAALAWIHPQRPPDGDGPWYLLLTHSLVEDGDIDLADDYAQGVSRDFLGRELAPQPGDPTGENGEVWSRHSPFLPLLLAGPWIVGGVLGVRLFLALLAAVLAWRTLALAHRWLPDRAGSVLLAWIALAFASPLMVFSAQIWVEVPAALAMVLALEAILRHPGRKGRIGLLVCLLALPLLKLRLALIALGCVLVAVRRRPEHRREAFGLLAGLGLLLLAYRLWLGSALGLHRPEEIFQIARVPMRALTGFVGLFLDSSFGLLPAAPIWALVMLGGVAALRSHRGLVIDVALISGPYLVTLVPRIEWFGGWSPPFRYAVVLLPLLTLGLALGFDEARRRGGRWLLAFLGLPTLLLAALWIALPGWSWNFADGRSHLLDTASLALRTDIARFFPSAIRPRPATWWWLGAWLALPLLVRLPGTSQRRPARAAAVGLGMALGLAALLPLAAARLPTRVVEAEDPWVEHHRGALAPERWLPQRVLYPGAWALPAGARILAPIRPGGARVTIRVAATSLGRVVPLQLLAGDRELAVVVVDGESWGEIEVGTFEWTADDPLVLTVPDTWPSGTDPRRIGAGRPAREAAAGGAPKRRSPVARPVGDGVLVDRVDLEWR